MTDFQTTAIITISLAISGYYAKYLNDLRITKKKSRLDSEKS